jgi:hypothetical protein
MKLAKEITHTSGENASYIHITYNDDESGIYQFVRIDIQKIKRDIPRGTGYNVYMTFDLNFPHREINPTRHIEITLQSLKDLNQTREVIKYGFNLIMGLTNTSPNICNLMEAIKEAQCDNIEPHITPINYQATERIV